MKVQKALKFLKDGVNVAINDKTFIPEEVQEVKMETGEMVYWILDGGDLWLSIDSESDEVIFFNKIDDEIDVSLDGILYAGEDYELSLEMKGAIVGEDGESEQVLVREFENESGEIFRAVEYSVTGEVRLSFGRIVTEDELQEA